MPPSGASYDAYKTVDIETASQGKLIIMLLNGAIQRAEEAKRQIEKGSCESVHKNLIRAQDIIAELRNALNMQAGDVVDNLDRIYEYIQHLLIKANISKQAGPIDECVDHMTRIRDAWQEVFASLAAEQDSVPKPPKLNQSGASVLDFQG
jgi:flagellar secretion chaperone FliS